MHNKSLKLKLPFVRTKVAFFYHSSKRNNHPWAIQCMVEKPFGSRTAFWVNNNPFRQWGPHRMKKAANRPVVPAMLFFGAIMLPFVTMAAWVFS